MARYREMWESPLDQTVIGFIDTEKNRGLPIAPENKDYQEFLEWQAAGGVADPAYTLADQQAAAIELCEAILDIKTSEPVLFLADMIIADKKHKDDIIFRVYAGDKVKDIKVKKADKKLKSVDKNDIEAMLTAIGNRDDAAFDNYEIAVTAIEAATDLTGIQAAITAFEAT